MNKEKVPSLKLAKKMYQGNDEELKAYALELYPELSEDIKDKVKSFEDACKITGEDPSSDFFNNTALRPHEIATRKVETIVKALIGDWEADWNNSDERKYYPWFKRSSSGSGFSFFDCAFGYSHSCIGSRQVFPSSELATYAGKQFTELYKEMHTL